MKLPSIPFTAAVLLFVARPLFAQEAASPLIFSKIKASDVAVATVRETSAPGPIVFAPSAATSSSSKTRQYQWKPNIVTTVFWIGEKPSANNPTPNRSSSWDANWAGSYGGFDNPDRTQRRNLIPIDFTPKQNPFYCALPYNDKSREGHRAEAPQVVPWFKEAYQGPGASVCKGRWVAIRKGTRVVYAQWEDAGPFRTDHWQYVFGNERPKPNLNQGAGLDVSPAVRDFLGLQDTDVTDWRFVDYPEVPLGPWAKYGDNNTFVQMQHKNAVRVVESKKPSAEIVPR